MRVLHVIDTVDPHPGHVAITLPGMLRALGARGVASDVVTGAAHDGVTADQLGAEELLVIEKEDRHRAMHAIAPRMQQTDVVHVHSPTANVSMVAAAGARSSRTPFVLSLYGAMALGQRHRSRLSLWFENRWFRKKFAKASVVHCIHADEAALLQQRGIAVATVVAPIGYDGAGEERGADSSADASLRLDWASDHRLLLYLGDIDGRLGLVPFLKACDQLETELAAWKIAIAGRPVGKWTELIAEAARRHGKEDVGEMIVYPNLAQQQALLGRAELLVCPAPTPIAPVCPLWALHCETPVVAGRAAGLDGVADVGAGLVVDANRKGLLAGIAEMVAQSPDELRQRGAAGKELVATRYSWSRMIGAFVAMYERAAQ